MEQIQQQIAIANRRLWWQRFWQNLVFSLCLSFSIAAIAIVVRKFVYMELPSEVWAVSWLGGCAVMGLIATVIWTSLTKISPVNLALEIDQRFALKERLSSAITLDEETRQSPAGQALLADAVRKAERIDVPTKFPINWRQRLWCRSCLP